MRWSPKIWPRWLDWPLFVYLSPLFGKDFLEEERKTMGAKWFEQEYMCGFIEDGMSVYSRDSVEAAFDDSVLPLIFG